VISNFPALSIKLRNEIRELRRSSAREETHTYVAEGPHLLQEVLRTDVVPEVCIIRDDADADHVELTERAASKGAHVVVSGAKNLALIADTSSPQSIISVLPFQAERPLEDRILVLDAVSDPGNVGTMIRTAAWFGFSDVVLGNGCADLYNAKTVRSTAGAHLHINVMRKRRLPDWFETLDDRPCFAAMPRGGEAPEVMHDVERFALIVGSEAHGIAADVLPHCDRRITIPGAEGVESLNAAIAAAILCYAGRRT
jgi:RNA methyltransferase, TrmH family